MYGDGLLGLDEADAPSYAKVPIPSPNMFNPHTNPITYFFPDGTNMTFTMADIDEFRHDQLFTDSIFSSQIGAAFVVICVMLCITHFEKRKTPIFALNVFNLLIVIVRGILFVHYYSGPLARTYTTFSWDVSDVPASEINASLASSVMSLLLMIGTQISLLLQIRICYALSPRSKGMILATCSSVSATATAAYISLGVYIIQLGDKPPDPRIVKWAIPTVTALVALSIVVYSGFFSWRMFRSVQNRRRMGFTGLGSLETLLLSGFQCLFFPAIFCIVENFVKFGGSASLAQAIVALVLPISHLWATKAQANSKLSISRIERLQQRKPFPHHLADLRDQVIRDISKLIRLAIATTKRVYRNSKSLLHGESHACTNSPSSHHDAPKDLSACPTQLSSVAEEDSSAVSDFSKDPSGFGKDLEAGLVP
ncbi:hypothetical protein ABW19_dt0200088 [Dactylella cylindrospora]|nr:hypothetical protein ABW19_dt0200088 [Dactylella cylindrospora]